MNVPALHLSVRVPWHDSAWNGKICSKPGENGSCMFLPRIAGSKDSEQEERFAGQWMHELEQELLPPCISEKVHFMSPHTINKKVSHPYSKNDGNQNYYGHYKETNLRYPGYSFAAVPYSWMLKNPKDNTSDKAAELNISYDPDKEPNLSFQNSWVQQLDNQRALLDTFIAPILPGHSLVFIYAKNIPFVDTTSRILIGVGRVKSIGQLTEYDYDKSQPITFRSILWERPVFHTIREGFEDGFLLPYHEFIQLAEKDDSIHIPDYIAFTPTFEEFSFGSEWVSNDSAIESLLIIAEKLKKFESILPGKNYEQQLKWIDTELSRIWKMRGPFPGLGAVLSGLKIPAGNLIAWQLDRLIRDETSGEVVKNPWDLVERLFQGDNSFLPLHLNVTISNTQQSTWDNYTEHEKGFLQLLSRMDVSNDQVAAVIDLTDKEQTAYLENPYLLYEETRHEQAVFTVSIIDKAIFSDPKLQTQYPLHPLTDISGALDKRRIRAVGIKLLEQAAAQGNTLLTGAQLVTAMDEQPLQPLCNPSVRNLLAIEEYLQEEITQHVLDIKDEIYYFKLKRFESIKDKIRNFVQKRSGRRFNPPIQQDWLQLLDREFKSIDQSKPQWHQVRDTEARQEKARALDVLANNRISVLIGPAGTGKTRLLNLFCQQPFIASGTILKVAPTGKARVKMGKDAKTLAQFLIKAKRFDPETGQYYINPDAETVRYDTVIVDEASMLTEEQLAALLDSLTGTERFILVGDYRQLPPIGAGRPFVDTIAYLQQENKGIAELKVLFRQYSPDNIPAEEPDRLDVRLGKWFSDDEIKKQEVDIFKEIAERPEKEWENISFIEWHNVRHLEEILIGVMNREIERLLLSSPGKELRNPQANFDTSLGANYYMPQSNWSGFGIESAEEIENWQILSPTRNLGYGTKVMNQQIQRTFRSKTKERAIFAGQFQKRKLSRPVGDDGIVFGDKVINNKNIKWDKRWNKLFNPNRIPDEGLLKYIANGEIGLHIGPYGEWSGPRPVQIAFASQPGYAYSFQESNFQEDGELQMELAYSITVHKSQGSGFRVVLFILPNPCPVLSRELFYTALTRQQDRIIILHQGSFNDYRKFTMGEYSETGRRLTDLFSAPALKLVQKKFYDMRYIQVSEKGEFMISKSEVIIADKLYHNHILYAYESPMTDAGGITIHPDFTIEDSDSGIVYYWEHLGLLTKDDYRSKWKRKQEWYARNGIVEYTQNRDADKQLILTRDKPDGGIDSSEIKSIINELFK